MNEETWMSAVRLLIRDAIDDLALDFVAYDRLEDESLSTEDVRKAFESEYVTLDQATQWFKEGLEKHL